MEIKSLSHFSSVFSSAHIPRLHFLVCSGIQTFKPLNPWKNPSQQNLFVIAHLFIETYYLASA